MIACLDVHYAEECASVACVLIESWTDAVPHQSFLAKVDQIQPYRPGGFYERELPCLLAVLDKIPSPPEICVVDGYAWVSPDGKPGLGAHLHEALKGAVPVVGVAKSSFLGMVGSPLMAPIYRGGSKKPLFVTSIGMDLSTAAHSIGRMHGLYRIPSILRFTDQLARGIRTS